MLEGLRAELSAAGFTAYDVILPGEPAVVAPLEGALRLRPDDGGGFVLETLDYGWGHRLRRAPDEASARRVLLDYLTRPLPVPAPMRREEVDGLTLDHTVALIQLRDRAIDAGGEGLLTEIPPRLPLDRVGALDGVHLYPLGTPFEMRSLPPSSLRPENDVPQFVTTETIPVLAFIQPGWFGRPGGGLRLSVAVPGIGIRDLVADGRLGRIHVLR